MKLRFIGQSDPLYCINGKIYDGEIDEEAKKNGINAYRVVDETGDDYLYNPNDFEVVEK